MPMARGGKPNSSNGLACAAGTKKRSAASNRLGLFIVVSGVRRLAGVEEVLQQAEELEHDLVLDEDGERGDELSALVGGEGVLGERGHGVARLMRIGWVRAALDAFDDEAKRARDLAGGVDGDERLERAHQGGKVHAPLRFRAG